MKPRTKPIDKLLFSRIVYSSYRILHFAENICNITIFSIAQTSERNLVKSRIITPLINKRCHANTNS